MKSYLWLSFSFMIMHLNSCRSDCNLKTTYVLDDKIILDQVWSYYDIALAKRINFENGIDWYLFDRLGDSLLLLKEFDGKLFVTLSIGFGGINEPEMTFVFEKISDYYKCSFAQLFPNPSFECTIVELMNHDFENSSVYESRKVIFELGYYSLKYDEQRDEIFQFLKEKKDISDWIEAEVNYFYFLNHLKINRLMAQVHCR